MRNKDILEKLLEIGAFLTFLALVINVSIQVITRNLLPSITVVWTEELSRLLFVYSIVFGAPLAMKKEEYVNVDIVLNLMNKKVRWVADLLIKAVSTVLFAIVSYKGIEFAKLGISQTSAVLRIPMVYAYSSISITCLLITVYGVYNMYGHISRIRE